MVKFENVSKSFGQIVALDSISFEVEKGEFAFLTGSSGAGKTTVIRLLLREFSPTNGKILIEGRNIEEIKGKDIPYYRRRIGVVFQDFKLLTERTVYENVRIALEIAGKVDEKEEAMIKEALEEVGMEKRASLFPRQLSGGEIQRAVLARALVAQPKIILADEPTGNLDPKTAKSIVTLLDRATVDGTTVIMATHNAEIVNSLKRHVVVLKDGKVLSDKKKGVYQED